MMAWSIKSINNNIHLVLRLSYLRFAGTVENKNKDEDITNLYYLGETKSIGTDWWINNAMNGNKWKQFSF